MEEQRRSNSELDSKLEQANERIEDHKRKERDLAEQVSRLKSRLGEKERQNEILRSDAVRAIKFHSDLEAKVDKHVPVMKPAAI